MRGHFKSILILAFIAGTPAFSESRDPASVEKRAREDLAKKLLKLSQSLDMKEAKYEEAQDGKSFDANSGNTFLSTTTIHYYVEST